MWLRQVKSDLMPGEAEVFREAVRKMKVIHSTTGTVQLAPLADRPLISVIVPSYNQGRYVRDTIESILSQEYRPIQIHVIDGGSTDETVDVLKSFGSIPELLWVSERDRGVVDAVNKGFAQVTGDLIAIQSSDDMYLPDAFTRVVSAFRKYPQAGLIYGDTIKVDAAGNELQKARIGSFSLENLFLLKTWIPQPSAFFRKEMLAACGGWDETIPYAPDTDLWIRMAFRTEVIKLDEFLSMRRMHDAQRDTQADKIVRDYTKMILQSPDIAAAPVGVRRAASASTHLIRIRYNSSRSYWKAAWHDVQAGLIDRRAFNFRRWWMNAAVFPARKLLSPVKQVILSCFGVNKKARKCNS